MALLRIFVFIAFAAAAFASPAMKAAGSGDEDVWTDIEIVRSDDGATAVSRISFDANFIVDTALKGVNAILPFQNTNITLPASIPFINNCTLYGIGGGFERDGNTTFNIHFTQINLNVSLTNREELGLLCDYKILSIEGKLKMSMKHTAVSAQFVQRLILLPRVTLEGLEIDTDIKLQVTGLPWPLSWVYSLQFRALMAIMGPLLITLMEQSISAGFNLSIG